MRILFICPSLEPGKDGVGDYVSRLAFSLLNEGHGIRSIALHDHFVSQVIEEKREQDQNTHEILRIPSDCTTKMRMNIAVQWLNSFDPNWISLQYVGFGYNKYGLPLELLNLRKKIGNTNLHIMFHELWCGTPKESKTKEKVLGILQKIFIKRMASTLKPRQVFTNTSTSECNLMKIGITSRLTPVFSNIPIDEEGSDGHWRELKQEKKLTQFLDNREDWLIVGFFGTIYRYMDLKKLLVHAAIAAADAEKKLGILSIGHGRGQDISKMAKEINASYWETGSLSSSMINRTMQNVDLGVVTTRVDGLNKSGSALAWLERGIPVIISEDDNTYNQKEMEAVGVYQINDSSDVWRSFYSKGNFRVSNNLKEASKAYARMQEE